MPVDDGRVLGVVMHGVVTEVPTCTLDTVVVGTGSNLAFENAI